MRQRTISLPVVIGAVLAIGGVSVVHARQAAKVDVTGAWIFTVQSAAGTTNPAVTLKQDGPKVTGRYSSQVMGEADLAGTVKGQAIEFTVTANVQGQKIELKYSGVIESADAMKGTLSAGELGDGTFTAKRK